MLQKGPVEKAKSYIEYHTKLHELDDERRKLHTGPCITISRETGARADKISEILVEFFKPYSYKDLEWTVFDKNLIEKVLQDHNLPQRLSKLMEEKKYSVIKSIMNELLGGEPAIWNLFQKTTKTILQLAQMGFVIILDRGANIITSKLKNSFHVRLVAPLEDRIPHVEELYGLSRKEAIDFIRKEDSDRKDYVTTYFHKNVDDPLLYNIIINTHLINDEEAAQIIGNAVLKKFPELFERIHA